MTTTETERALLDEGMLQRFDERAPDYDRDNEFFTEDFEELRASGYFLASVPEELRRRRAEPGRDQRAATAHRLRARRRPPSPSTCTTTSSASCADLHRAGDPSGDWMLAQGRRGPHLRRRARRVGQRHPGAAVDRRRPTRVDGGWEFTGHKIFGSLSPVWTYLGIHAHGHERPGQPQGRARVPPPRLARLPDRADVGHAGHAGHDVQRHDPRPGVRARRGDRRSCRPAGFAGAGMFHVGALRMGPARLRRRLLVDRPAGLRRHGRPDAPAHVDRADPLDGVPPRGAAPHRRDAHPPRGDRRPTSTASATDWVDRRRPRHGLAG